MGLTTPPPSTPHNDEDLQFDRAVPSGSNGAAATDAMVCSACSAALRTWYYDVNGAHVCTACRAKAANMAGALREWGPTLTATLFGFGAAIAGAIIYYGVIAITDFEIGIVALLIGYMVGFAIRKGSGGRGGRRLQVAGALLTYASVAMAYTPLAMKGVAESALRSDSTAMSLDSLGSIVENEEGAATGAAISVESLSVAPNAARIDGNVNPLLAVGALMVFALALPLLVVFGSMPSGLISGLIIGIGMRQAWVMTRATEVTIAGPFKVGNTAGDASATAA